MSEEIIYASLRFAGVALAMATVLVFAWKRTALDIYRSDLFAIRDRLFDFMWRNGHDFDTPAYRHLRDEINGFIRFSHQFDLAGIVAVSLFARHGDAEHGLLAEIKKVENEEIRKVFLDAYRAVGRRSYRYLYLGGTQALVVVPTIVAYVLLRNGGRWLSEMPPWVADRMALLGRDDPSVAAMLLKCA